MIDQIKEQSMKKEKLSTRGDFVKQKQKNPQQKRQFEQNLRYQKLNIFQKKILPQHKSQQIIYQNQIIVSEMNQMEEQNNSISQQSMLDQENPISKKYLNRSSNNSYKKYASAAKKNLFRLISSSKKKRLNQDCKKYKSSRIYFFWFLIYALTHLTMKDVKKYIKGFVRDVKKKIFQYEDEAKTTSNKALEKFRLQEIEDLKLSLISLKIFATRSIQEGIQIVYKKNREQISKLTEYKKSVITIKKEAQKAKFSINSLNLEKLIDTQINRKIKQRSVVLGEIPKFIQIDNFSQQDQKEQKQVKESLKLLNCKIQEEKAKEQEKIQKIKQIQNKKTKEQDSEEEQPKVECQFGLMSKEHPISSFFIPKSNFMNFPFSMNTMGFNIYPSSTFKFQQNKQENQNQSEDKN